MTFRESDGRIVPLKSGPQPDRTKPSNIGAGKAIRPVHDPDRAPPVLRDGSSVITRLDQIHQRAVTQPNAVFNNLFSLLNYELLWFAFRRLNRGKAPGVDGVTLEDYGMERRGRWASLAWKISSFSEPSS